MIVDKNKKGTLLEDKLSQYKTNKLPKRKNLEFSNLSMAQKRLWFLEKLNPQQAIYNIPEAITLKGTLDIKILEKSFNLLIKRHETLRTIYLEKDREPIQIIKEYVYERLNVLELKGSIKKLLLKLSSTSFEIEGERLFRYYLIRISENEHILFLNLHHSISDGWSMGILWRELSQIYNSLIQGKELLLPEITIQYADFAEWEKTQLEKKIMNNQLEYWKTQLENHKVLELNYDKKRNSTEKINTGDIITEKIPIDLKNKVSKFCKSTNITMYQMMLTVFNLLIYKYTNEKDITVGTPVSGRNKKELESIIGFFSNSLCIRTKFNGEDTFYELLKNVKDQVYDAFDNNNVPFDKVVDEIKPFRELNSEPIFRIMFSINNSFDESLEFIGLKAQSIHINNFTSKYDLTFVVNVGDELNLIVEYNTSLYEKSTIVRIVNHFIELVDVVIESPDVPIKNISILSPEEKKLILEDWNDTSVNYNGELCLHELFEKQVKQYPDKTALVINDHKYTYKDINNEANVLARKLAKMGLKPDEFVGTYFNRSKDMIVSILGVLKAGGAYVPLDINYPNERLDYIIKKANLKMLVTSKGNYSNIAAIAKPTSTIIIDELNKENHSDLGNLERYSSPQNAAYMIFTSGSTGKPKGVVVEHRNVVNFINAQRDILHFTEKENMLQFASICFDASVWEIFLSLSYGATLSLLPNDINKLDIDFIELINKYKISIGLFPPSLLSTLNPKDLPSLKTVIAAGEKCPHNIAVKWSKGKEFWNAYGPTEATVITTLHKYANDQTLPIGKPIPNVKVYVLDEQLKPVPIGSVGELYIGGAGVSRGYIREPKLNELSFIRNPFDNSSEKIYKTGDLVKYLPSGELEYIDRIDTQIQIKGFRVELEEIENVLIDLSEIKQAVVKYWGDLEESSILAAYIVLHDQSSIDDIQLIQHLKKYLPNYMIPNSINILEEIPHTPNGKMDRRNLPKPVMNRNGEKEIPKTKNEKKIAEVWGEFLGIEVGRNDNFFEIGGDSLLILKIISYLREDGIILTPSDFYKNPTIKDLSLQFKSTREEAQIEDIEGLFNLSPIQKWFFENDLTNKHHWNFSLMFNVEQGINEYLVKEALDILIRHHDSLRLRFTNTDNEIKQYYDGKQMNIPFSIVNIGQSSEEEKTFEEQCNYYQGTLDIFNGPLIRGIYFKSNKNDKNKLLLVIHHLLIDWISGDIIFEDLKRILRMLINEKKVLLPEKSTSFKTWTEKLEDYSKSPELLYEYNNYWNQINTRELKTIPTDYANQKNNRESLVTSKLKINSRHTKILSQKYYKKYKVRIHELILSGIVKVILDWSRMDSLIIDIDRHGREDIISNLDVSRTVGWFTSLFPFYYHNDSNIKSNIELMLNVKKDLNKVPNNGLGYGLLDYLNNDVELNIPQSNILFNFFGQNYEEQTDESFSYLDWSNASTGILNSPDQERIHIFEIIVLISEGELTINWSYSKNLHQKETIDTLLDNLESYLISLI